MSVFRIRFTVAGGHVHCRLFESAAPGTTGALCGEFVVRRGDEFADLVKACGGVDFIGDDQRVGIEIASTP